MILARRNFLIGASASLIACPAIVQALSLMPVRALMKRVGVQALYVDVNGGVIFLLQDAECLPPDWPVLAWSDGLDLNRS
jgi:hypothetical protein